MFKLKGDYFDGAFHLAKNQDELILKQAPSETSIELWQCPIDYQHIEAVVESAKRGFKIWRQMSFQERVQCFSQFRKIVDQRKNEIAKAIAWETGKPLWESETEASALATKVDVTVKDSMDRIKPQTIKEVMPQIDGHVLFKPLGVTLVIGPFNFPCHLANGQILSALLAGNSIIFKPSEKTIYSAQLLIECLAAAGFPRGVINLINGTGKTASELSKHPAVKGIFFTGSYQVGQKILANTYHDLNKLVALELGGKNTSIIHQDANSEHALTELMRACYLTSGQRCTSTSTILVHQKIFDQFQENFSQLAGKITIGHAIKYQNKPFMGALIDQMAVDKYLDYLKLAKDEGAINLLESYDLRTEFSGHYVAPSLHLFKAKPEKSQLLKTEIFGPNACLLPYENIEEAIEIANDTEYGLAAAVFTKDQKIYDKCWREIDCGLLNLNRSTVGASAKLPFGGVKNSGNYHPAAVAMIDHCVYTMASLESLDDQSSKVSSLVGLRS